jgi:hypothetical protein
VFSNTEVLCRGFVREVLSSNLGQGTRLSVPADVRMLPYWVSLLSDYLLVAVYGYVTIAWEPG